jgi:hypothetical protein
MNAAFQQLKQMMQSPLFKRAQQMASGKTPAECEQIARNICREKGVDYDTALNQFKKQFGVSNF